MHVFYFTLTRLHVSAHEGHHQCFVFTKYQNTPTQPVSLQALQPTHTTEDWHVFNILILTRIYFNPTTHALTLHERTMNVIWTDEH